MGIKNQYGIFKKLRMCIWLCKTKFICHQARFFRFPFELRGRQFIDFGLKLTIGQGCRFEAFSEDGKKTIFFGNYVQVNDYVHISSIKKVKIGNNVLMASHIYISDNSHGSYKGTDCDTSPDIIPIKRPYYVSPVVIEDNVWIGEGVVVMPGVTIGRGSIIGANSVVTKSIPPECIAVGQPAKIIKRFDKATKKWTII
jgi:lipopolysaccharide O-acetyltransferase